MTRKRRAVYAFLGTIAGVALILGLIVWDAHRRAERICREHDADVTAIIAGIRARARPSRPILLGAPLPGDGTSAFLKVLQEIYDIPQVESGLVPEIAGDFMPDDEPDEDLISFFYEAHRSRIEDLRTALRHETLRLPYDYEDGLGMEMPQVTNSLRTARFLTGLATHRYRLGEDGRVLDPLLMVLLVGEEIDRDGALISPIVRRVLEEMVEEAWRDVLAGHDLGAGDLERAARSFDALAKVRAELGDSIVVEDAIARRGLLNHILGRRPQLSDPREDFWEYRSWRTLYSRKIALVGALPQLKNYYAELLRIRSVPPDQWAALAKGVEERALIHANLLMRRILPGIAKIIQRETGARMRWTLMRVATAIAWYEVEKGGFPVTLADLVPRYLPSVSTCPLSGKPLGYTAGKVWSFGVDGVDDGGTPNPKGDEEPGGDVVWFVKRARK